MVTAGQAALLGQLSLRPDRPGQNNYSPRLGSRGGLRRSTRGSSAAGIAFSSAARPTAGLHPVWRRSPRLRKTPRSPPAPPIPSRWRTASRRSRRRPSPTPTPSQELQTGVCADVEFRAAANLSHGLLVELEYIGTKGTGLAVTEQPDRAVAGSSLAQALQIGNATGFSYLTSRGIPSSTPHRRGSRADSGAEYRPTLYTRLQIHRRRFEFFGCRRHGGPVPSGSAPGARPVDLRPAAPSDPRLHCCLRRWAYMVCGATAAGRPRPSPGGR